jgi:hypothetical protein
LRMLLLSVRIGWTVLVILLSRQCDVSGKNHEWLLKLIFFCLRC